MYNVIDSQSLSDINSIIVTTLTMKLLIPISMIFHVPLSIKEEEAQWHK